MAVGIQTIAEDAEDEETLQLIQQMGIRYAQGYVVHRPELLVD